MANHIEEAKSGRASCRTCKKAIDKGELRLGVEAASSFGDTPSMQWHHLLCAATKLPAELEEALKAYPGEVANRAELDVAMADAIKSGHAKPGGFPYADRAPTGRAKCIHCKEPIAKDSLRVAVEREIEMGAGMQTSAGYLHPKCFAPYLAASDGDTEEATIALTNNSRIPEADLASVLAEIGASAG